MPTLPTLSDADIATGWVSGLDRPQRRPDPDPEPVEVLRRIITTALERTPCIVSFSGGRDSSIILALAADTARKEGLEPPIAVSHVYPDDPEADEDDYQQMVIRHLRQRGLAVQWERVQIRDEFDLVGPLIAPVLSAHGGAIWPASVGPTIDLSARAPHGTVLTGEFGDEITGAQRMTYIMGVVRRRGRGFGWVDWKATAAAGWPRHLRFGPRRDVHRPWLTPRGHRLSLRRHAHDLRREPLLWNRSVPYWPRRRAVRIARSTMGSLALMNDCDLVHPLGDPEFVASYAAFGGWAGVPSRSAATRLLSDGLLPEAVVVRRAKVFFNASRFGNPTRDFVSSWDGSGVDGPLVDGDHLARLWKRGEFSGATSLLLQEAWLGRGRG